MSPGLQNSSRLDQFDSRGNQGFNSGAESMQGLPNDPETHRHSFIKLLKIMVRRLETYFYLQGKILFDTPECKSTEY